MSAAPVRQIVVVGRDIDLWLSALAIHRAMAPSGVDVRVVELPSRLGAGQVVACLPAFAWLQSMIGIDEAAAIRTADGTFSLGQRLEGFSGPGTAFFHPYGDHAAPVGLADFMQVWAAALGDGLDTGFDAFALNTVAAAAGRMMPDEVEHGCHLHARPYMRALRATARSLGIEVHNGFVAARLHADGAGIAAIRLEDGSEIGGDLFIDASGADAVLAGPADEDWSGLYPGDRVLTAYAEPISLPACSQSAALEHGCLHILPAQTVTGLEYVFDGRAQNDAEAYRAVAAAVPFRLAEAHTVSPLRPGRCVAPWTGNCLAVGEAACRLDAIGQPRLHVLQWQLAQLMALFPLDADMRLEAAEYNAAAEVAQAHVRDFQLAHYRLSRAGESAFWMAARDLPTPAFLAHKMEVFAASGRVALGEDEAFDVSSWEAVMAGLGPVPRQPSPLAQTLARPALAAELQARLKAARERVAAMPSHADILKSCGRNAG